MADLPPLPALTPAEAEELLTMFPEAFATKANKRVDSSTLIYSFGPLDSSHVKIAEDHLASGKELGVKNPDLKSIRHTHHRLAQLLAGGMDETRAARLCNYNPQRVSQLKGDPSFQELLAYYSSIVEEEFTDFIRTAADLSLDFLGLLQQQLDETPEKFTPSVALEAIRTLADRTGHAPVQKSQNVNVNVNLGDRLRLARERATQDYIESSFKVLPR